MKIFGVKSHWRWCADDAGTMWGQCVDITRSVILSTAILYHPSVVRKHPTLSLGHSYVICTSSLALLQSREWQGWHVILQVGLTSGITCHSTGEDDNSFAQSLLAFFSFSFPIHFYLNSTLPTDSSTLSTDRSTFSPSTSIWLLFSALSSSSFIFTCWNR